MVTVNTSSVVDLHDPSVARVLYLLFEDPKAWSSKPDAPVVFAFPDGKRNTLIVAHCESGFIVHFNEDMKGMWLLVRDRSRLSGFPIEIDEDYYVSEGLVSTVEATRAAVDWFVRHGTRCSSLERMTDHQMPKDAHF